MALDTVASILRRNGLPVPFKALPIGATFECNGNVWTKHGKQVATGIWPAILPRCAYFRNNETCHTQEATQ